MNAAMIVPDQASWTMWGRDPAQVGLRPAEAPERARQLLVPDPVPEALAAAVRDAWSRIPPPRSYVAWPRGHAGVAAADLLEAQGHREPEQGGPAHGDGDHGEHGNGGHDHHDMMAIVGDPSADGLVMESIELQLGPLAPGLPGGLVLELSLDGDVVERCHPRATLEMPLGPVAGGGSGDPLAPAAWTAAIGTALESAAGRVASEGTARLRVAAVEAERALSHLCWLRAFGFVLGWAQLSDRAHEGAVALIGPRLLLEEAAARPGPDGVDRDALRGQLEAAATPMGRVRRLLQGSRRIRARTRGRARVAAQRISGAGLTGPAARAAGVSGDARSADPLYEALGFREALREEGDAEARTELRVTESVAALDLAVAALREEGSSEQGAVLTAAGSVEGPRGPVRARHVDGRLHVVAPGNARLLELAGETVVGLEIGRALTGLASFDLSGWKVPG